MNSIGESTNANQNSNPPRRRFPTLGFITIATGVFSVGIVVTLLAVFARERALAEQTMALRAAAETYKVASPGSDILSNPTTRLQENVYHEQVRDERTGEIHVIPRRRLVRVVEYPQNSPAEADLNNLVSQFRAATPARKEDLKKDLTTKLSDLFEAQHKEQTTKIEQLRAEVQRTQELLDRRMSLKSKIIDRRLGELTGVPDELSWNPAQENMPPRFVPQQSVPLNPNYGQPVPSSEAGNIPSASPTAGTLSWSPLIEGTPVRNEPVGTLTPMPQQPTTASDLANPNILTPLNASPALQNPSQSILPAGEPQQSRDNTVLPSSLEASPAPSSTLPESKLRDPSEGKTNLKLLPENTPLAEPTFESQDNKLPEGLKAEAVSESTPSMMRIGFKLKRLTQQLIDAGSQPTNRGKELRSELEEYQAAWDYEKSKLFSAELQATADYALVHKQLELANQQLELDQEKHSSGSVGSDEVMKSKAQSLAAEREELRARAMLERATKPIEWMLQFEKTMPKTPQDAPSIDNTNG